MGKEFKPMMAVQVLLDDSGSMGVIRRPTIAALNGFMAQLATAMTPVGVSITKFGGRLGRTIVDNVPVDEMPKITANDYDPHQGTDIGASIVEAFERRMDAMEAKQKVLVVLTDGLGAGDLTARPMIEKRRRQGWLVIFLGAIQPEDSAYKKVMLLTARQLGISKAMTLAFDSRNVEKIMAVAAQSVLRFAGADIGSGQKIAEFTDEERGIA